jgi:hypothetical protein
MLGSGSKGGSPSYDQTVVVGGQHLEGIVGIGCGFLKSN